MTSVIDLGSDSLMDSDIEEIEILSNSKSRILLCKTKFLSLRDLINESLLFVSLSLFSFRKESCLFFHRFF